MDYDPRSEPHGLAHDPGTCLVVPRPIGWITTVSPAGVVNLAPYSFFNAVADDPYMVMFANTGREAYGQKDTLRNIEATGEFVYNVATWALREKVTSKGGTTHAAITSLQADGVGDAIERAVKAAHRRAGELGDEFGRG